MINSGLPRTLSDSNLNFSDRRQEIDSRSSLPHSSYPSEEKLSPQQEDTSCPSPSSRSSLPIISSPCRVATIKMRYSKTVSRCLPQTYLDAFVLSQPVVASPYYDEVHYYCMDVFPKPYPFIERLKPAKAVVRHFEKCPYRRKKNFCHIDSYYKDVPFKECISFFPRLSNRSVWAKTLKSEFFGLPGKFDFSDPFAQDPDFWGYDVACDIGRREEMQDRVLITRSSDKKVTLFSIFDGHGGSEVSQRCSLNLGSIFQKCYSESLNLVMSLDWAVRILDDIVTNFLRDVDIKISQAKLKKKAPPIKVKARMPLLCGSTLLSVGITEQKIVVAQLGDTEGFLYRTDFYLDNRAIRFMRPHTTKRQDEVTRIAETGGTIIFKELQTPSNIKEDSAPVGRVAGIVAVTRSVGDALLKDWVIGKPEMLELERTQSDEFIILASDGFWDVTRKEAAGRQLLKYLHFQKKIGHNKQNLASGAARFLVNAAIIDTTYDNVSVIVVFLNEPANILRRAEKSGFFEDEDSIAEDVANEVEEVEMAPSICLKEPSGICTADEVDVKSLQSNKNRDTCVETDQEDYLLRGRNWEEENRKRDLDRLDSDKEQNPDVEQAEPFDPEIDNAGRFNVVVKLPEIPNL
eukprot:GHVP01048494.1.p1 GENE.GHVP01048494.1~~GHVP01048494.1.p1  ORF type:complete len:631 (+),score=106.81 GHVP01048494.1:1584-3476(+)